MVDRVLNIDFSKYKTFFLEYYKDDNVYSYHIVRPCTETYETITDKSRSRTYILEAAVMTFTHDTSIAEALMDCAIHGISVDFIDILVPIKDKSAWSDHKCIQVIDTHKEDVTKMFAELEAKQHYVAINTKKTDALKFLVVDRYKQDSKIKFLSGKYDKSAIIAGFVEQNAATEFCKKLNNDG